jgi:hypothetical protein
MLIASVWQPEAGRCGQSAFFPLAPKPVEDGRKRPDSRQGGIRVRQREDDGCGGAAGGAKSTGGPCLAIASDVLDIHLFFAI